MFLIDTNVISEARKGRRADAGVQAFWGSMLMLVTRNTRDVEGTGVELLNPFHTS